MVALMYHFHYNSHYLLEITELSNETYSINPCTNLDKDIYVMPVDIGDAAYTLDRITTNANSRKKIKGCCSLLSPLLQVENIKQIMDVMRMSIGATIPLSPRYSSLNSTHGIKILDVLLPPDQLESRLKDRYTRIGYFHNLYHF